MVKGQTLLLQLIVSTGLDYMQQSDLVSQILTETGFVMRMKFLGVPMIWLVTTT